MSGPAHTKIVTQLTIRSGTVQVREIQCLSALNRGADSLVRDGRARARWTAELGRLLDVGENDQDFAAANEAEFLPRDDLERSRIGLEAKDVCPERRVLALQFREFLPRMKQFLAGLDGLEDSAIAEHRVEQQHAAKKNDGPFDLPRPPTLLVQRVRGSNMCD